MSSYKKNLKFKKKLPELEGNVIDNNDITDFLNLTHKILMMIIHNFQYHCKDFMKNLHENI